MSKAPIKVAGKFGLKPYVEGSIKFKFRDYLEETQLPVLPRQFGHVGNRPPVPGGWGMMGNDQHGDCVMAGAAHETMLYALATRRPVPRFSTATVVRQYLTLTGGGDDGLDAVVAANWRRKTGIADDTGTIHKIEAYALITEPSDLFMATYLFGAAGIGVCLPDNADWYFGRGHAWSDTRQEPNKAHGHYMAVFGRNSAGNIVLGTWGNLQAATVPWIERYMMVGVAYFSLEYLMANNLSPELINRDALIADLSALPSAQQIG